MTPGNWEKWRKSIQALPPVDWFPAPPDFVGIGVQKAGTSWWYRLLEGHPDVYTRHFQKERSFFQHYGLRPFGDADAAAYAELFYRPEGGKSGEWTPNYMCDFWVPEALHKAAPNTKVLALLRDPVPRYLSGIRHSVYVGKVPRRVAQRDAYLRGLYHAQLSGFLRYFDRSQVLVQLYEECVAEPKKMVRRTYEFLGLDPDYVPTNLDVRYNESIGKRFVAPDNVIERLKELYRPDVEALAATFPDLDLGRWPSFA